MTPCPDTAVPSRPRASEGGQHNHELIRRMGWLFRSKKISKFPACRHSSPRGDATPKEAVERVTMDFPAWTPADLAMKQPSGSDLKWPNMVAWVRNTLCDKGAIDRTVRGSWVITETGRQMVAAAAHEHTSPLFPPWPHDLP